MGKKPKPDTTKPTVPTELTATAIGPTAIRLTWKRSTDNVGVTGYYINRDGARKALATAATHDDTGLTPSTTYTYQVIAFDARGNIAASAGKAATTHALPVPSPADPPPPPPSPADPPPPPPPPPSPADQPGSNYLLGDSADKLTTDDSDKLVAA